MVMETIDFWKAEKAYESPHKTKNFTFSGFADARLYVKIEPDAMFGWMQTFGAVYINGNKLGDTSPFGGEFNFVVAEFQLRQGENSVDLDATTVPGLPFTLTITLYISAASVTEKTAYEDLLTVGYIALGSVVAIAFIDAMRRRKK